jgi:hypothetical protein
MMIMMERVGQTLPLPFSHEIFYVMPSLTKRNALIMLLDLGKATPRERWRGADYELCVEIFLFFVYDCAVAQEDTSVMQSRLPSLVSWPLLWLAGRSFSDALD